VLNGTGAIPPHRCWYSREPARRGSGTSVMAKILHLQYFSLFFLYLLNYAVETHRLESFRKAINPWRDMAITLPTLALI
jgi:hypothetical protein